MTSTGGCSPTASLRAYVDQAQAEKLIVILDSHPRDAFKAMLMSGGQPADDYRALWSKLAEVFKGVPAPQMYFELLNEPGSQSKSAWWPQQQQIVKAIRAVDPDRGIIASPPELSTIANLVGQQPYPEGNIVYTFHFYSPMMFTHQGAEWGSSVYRTLNGVPYPLSVATLEQFQANVADVVSRSKIQADAAGGDWDSERITAKIATAGAWSRQFSVPLICTEFGVYKRNAAAGDRLKWLTDVRTALEGQEIAWSIWEYIGGFGIADGRFGQRQIDDGVGDALGLALSEER